MFEHFWIWLVTFGYVASLSLSDSKDPYDNGEITEKFHYWNHWLSKKIDNLLIKFFLSLGGLAAADEVGVPFMEMWLKSMGLQMEIAIEGISTFSVFIVIIMMIKIFGKKKDG